MNQNQIEKIKSALNYLSADVSRNEWVEIAMAIKSEIDNDLGFELFDQWSRLSNKYNQKDTYHLWHSIDANGKVNIGTLYYKAKQNSWHEKTDNTSNTHLPITLNDKEKKYQEMAHLAQTIYNDSKEASNDYPYLKNKGALPHGVRVLNEDVSVFASGFGKKGHLIIPLLNTKGSILSLLTILPNKKINEPDKCLMRGAKKSGCFYPMGTYNKGNPIILCEGFATASSIYQATGLYTIMGVDAGNLKPVIEGLSTLYPDNQIIIACDNDQYKNDKNTGIEQAKKAAQSRENVSIIIPEFNSISLKPTDFNDLHLLEGLSVVSQQINGALTTIPNGYYYDKGHLYYQGEDSDTPIYLSDELKVIADIKDYQYQGYGIRLSWYDKYHQKHYWSMPAKFLASRGFEPIEQELRDGGLNISDSADAKRYLKRFLNHAKPKQCLTSVNKTGWYNQSYVLLNKIYNQPKQMPYVLNESSTTLSKNINQSGGLQDWQNHISRYALGNDLMILTLSFGFVAPLLKLLDIDNFGLHFYGSSSTGKTTLASVLASIWSDQNFIKRWRVTTNGLEAMAVMHNDGLLILDEIAQVNAYEVDQISYMLGNGSGKARANRKGNAKKIETFRLAYFSTGELSIVEKVKESGKRIPAGAQVRFIDIDIDQKYGVFDHLHSFDSGGELSNHLKQHAKKYYGTAIDHFITELVKDIDYWKNEITDYMEDFIDEFKDQNISGQAQRVLKSFALISAAGHIATLMGITGWSDQKGTAGSCHAYFSVLAIYKKWLKSFGNNSLEEQEIISRLFDFLDTNSQRFQGEGKFAIIPANRAGFIKPHQGRYAYTIHNKVWSEEIFKGLSIKSVNRILKTQGVLIDNAPFYFDKHKTRAYTVVYHTQSTKSLEHTEHG